MAINPLILPSTIPIDDGRVQNELTRYLADNWTPVIETDVDGANSLPLRIDSEVPNLGKLSATRRVARTVYLGSAPTTGAAHRGIDDGRVKLGCVSPGEAPATFGDALRRLAASATYLYQDGARVWYDTQPTVTKLAEDRAVELIRKPDAAASELEKRLTNDLRQRGDFQRIHCLPSSSADIPDDMETRLVVLNAEQLYSREADNQAQAAAKTILESRGNTPRLFRNTFVFLAADKVRYQDLDEALRRYLAWDSIVADTQQLNLDPHQNKQAEVQRQAAADAVTARLPETYQWLLTPQQASPQSAIEWKAIRLAGSGALAERVSKKLRGDELMIVRFAGSMLRHHMDQIPLWREDHASVRELADYFARYIYLPRLAGPDVLAQAAEDGVASLTWEMDAFAVADGYDETAKRYRGLKAGGASISPLPDTALLVKPAVARAQLDAEAPPPTSPTPTGGPQTDTDVPAPQPSPAPAKKARRFHGTVSLDTTRVSRDAGVVAEEVIAHLSGLVGADVRVTLDIAADIPDGAPDHVVRTVNENSRSLKFSSHEFEES